MVALPLLLLATALPALAVPASYEGDTKDTAFSSLSSSVLGWGWTWPSTTSAQEQASATQAAVQAAETSAAPDAAPDAAPGAGSGGAPSGTTKLQLAGSALCLATMDSSEVHLMACADDAAAHRWAWEPAGDEGGVPHYLLRSEAHGVCLTKEPVAGRPGYISTRLRATLESCGTAFTWGWYGDRLCIKEWYCLGVDASTPRDGSGLRFYGNAQWAAAE